MWETDVFGRSIRNTYQLSNDTMLQHYDAGVMTSVTDERTAGGIRNNVTCSTG